MAKRQVARGTHDEHEASTRAKQKLATGAITKLPAKPPEQLYCGTWILSKFMRLSDIGLCFSKQEDLLSRTINVRTCGKRNTKGREAPTLSWTAPLTKACRINDLPWEVLVQIMRHLVPTGDILHVSSTRNIDPELHKHFGPSQLWHIIHHMKAQQRPQHRFLPDASLCYRRNLTAIARVTRRMNDIFNNVLYGGNTWLLDLTATTGPTSLPTIDRSCWQPGHPEYLRGGTCATVIEGLPMSGFMAAWPSQLPVRSLATWPLTHRTAPYVRDLAITAQLGRDWHDRPFNDPWAESFCSFAAAEQLEEIVALFADKKTSESDNEARTQHSLRHLAVQLYSYDRAGWRIVKREPSAAGDDEFVRRNWSPDSLHLRQYARPPRTYGRRQMAPVEPRGAEKLWEPLRRLRGIRKVELDGILPAALAFELKTSMMSSENLQ